MAYVALLLVATIGGTLIEGQGNKAQQNTPTVTVAVTAFCIAGKTRSGTPTKAGVAAADLRIFPLGTRLRVTGLDGRYDGTYTVQDSGRAVSGHELDIFIADCAAAKRFGRQKARVRVLQRGEPARPRS